MAYRETTATRAAHTARRASLERAATSIIAEDGFRAATVKAVTTRAQTSSGLLYRYFESRENLLAAVFRTLAARELEAVRTAVAEAAPHGSTAALTALVDSFTHRALAARRLAWALLVEPVDAGIDVERLAYRRAYADLVTTVVEHGMAAGELPDQDAALAGAGVVGLIGEALTGPLSPLADQPPAHRTCAAIGRLVLGAVGAVGARATGSPGPAPDGIRNPPPTPHPHPQGAS